MNLFVTTQGLISIGLAAVLIVVAIALVREWRKG